MVAEPGTAWTKSKAEVPVKGRTCIPSLDSLNDDFFWCYENSMEGLEVLMMYGYKLSYFEMINICVHFVVTADDPKYHLLKMLKLMLASSSSDFDRVGWLGNWIYDIDAVHIEVAVDTPGTDVL
jgi:hypothetical protein